MSRKEAFLALTLSVLLLSGCGASSYSSSGENRNLESAAYGLPKAMLSAEEAATIPDLYSPELTAAREIYLWHGASTEYNLEVDRILPLDQVRRLSSGSWTPEEKRRFGADWDNFSVTSHVANNWKAVKTPSAIFLASAQGTFSWTDDCVDAYRTLIQSGVGCSGLPENFDSCGYSESYLLIASRYELKLPEVDLEALKNLSEGC